MKKFVLGVMGICWLPWVMASPMAITLKPGQWEIQSQSEIEGRDLTPVMHRIKQQAGAFLNEQQRKKLDLYDPNQFAECLTAKQANLFADPHKGLDLLASSLGQCQLQLDGQTATSIQFSGTCDATKQGIAGRLQGELHYISTTLAKGYVEGKGTMPAPVQLLVLGTVLPEVEVRNTFTARWQQNSCSVR